MEVTKPSNLKSMTTAVIGFHDRNAEQFTKQLQCFQSTRKRWEFLSNVKTDGRVEAGSDESGVVSQVCVSSGPAISTFQAGMGSVVMDKRQHPPPPRDSLCLRQSSVTSTNTNCVNTRDGRGRTRELLIECEICFLRGWRIYIPGEWSLAPGDLGTNLT